jgi:ssRNA-specific RNase YbeY (16S rRNA maturation enzyme)
VFLVELDNSGFRYLNFGYFAKKGATKVLSKGIGERRDLLVMESSRSNRKTIAFVVVGSPTISKQFIKKKEMTSMRFMSVNL